MMNSNAACILNTAHNWTSLYFTNVHIRTSSRAHGVCECVEVGQSVAVCLSARGLPSPGDQQGAAHDYPMTHTCVVANRAP